MRMKKDRDSILSLLEPEKVKVSKPSLRKGTIRTSPPKPKVQEPLLMAVKYVDGIPRSHYQYCSETKPYLADIADLRIFEYDDYWNKYRSGFFNG